MGPTPVLSALEELPIKNWIIAKAKVGFLMHKNALKDAVQEILKETDRPNTFADDRPGKTWINLFLKRHPEITNTNAQNFYLRQELLLQKEALDSGLMTKFLNKKEL